MTDATLKISSEATAPLVWCGEAVATTEQLAAFYGVQQKIMRNNHQRNRSRFVEGKHMVTLTGGDLRAFKHETSKRGLVKPNLNSLTLWTRRGAARHAKMLNSDRAWDVHEMLEDSYFAGRAPAALSPAVTVSAALLPSEPRGGWRSVPLRAVWSAPDLYDEAVKLRGVLDVYPDLSPRVAQDAAEIERALMSKCAQTLADIRYRLRIAGPLLGLDEQASGRLQCLVLGRAVV